MIEITDRDYQLLKMAMEKFNSAFWSLQMHAMLPSVWTTEKLIANVTDGKVAADKLVEELRARDPELLDRLLERSKEKLRKVLQL